MVLCIFFVYYFPFPFPRGASWPAWYRRCCCCLCCSTWAPILSRCRSACWAPSSWWLSPASYSRFVLSRLLSCRADSDICNYFKIDALWNFSSIADFWNYQPTMPEKWKVHQVFLLIPGFDIRWNFRLMKYSSIMYCFSFFSSVRIFDEHIFANFLLNSPSELIPIWIFFSLPFFNFFKKILFV